MTGKKGGKEFGGRNRRERRWREKGVGTILAGDTMAGSNLTRKMAGQTMREQIGTKNTVAATKIA